MCQCSWKEMLHHSYRSIFDGWNVLLFWEVFYSFWLATLLFHISRGKQVWCVHVRACARASMCVAVVVRLVNHDNLCSQTCQQQGLTLHVTLFFPDCSPWQAATSSTSKTLRWRSTSMPLHLLLIRRRRRRGRHRCQNRHRHREMMRPNRYWAQGHACALRPQGANLLLGVRSLHDQGRSGDEWRRLLQPLFAAVEFGHQGSADRPHIFSCGFVKGASL